MKWSKYNTIYESPKHGHLLFNALSGAFLDINDEPLRKTISQIMADPENFNYDDHKRLKDYLLSAAILCMDEQANINMAAYLSLKSRFDDREPVLTIIPTLDCNFRCTYCYEGKLLRPSKMSKSVSNGIKNYINSHFLGQVNKLKVQWYGGEALLEFELIKELSSYIDGLHIPYQASIVTNGSLLTIDKIAQLEALKINEIQVTLDGIEATHNKRRIAKDGNGTFKLIIDNLKLLHRWIMTNDYKITVNIRVNLDKDNKDEYNELRRYLKQEFPMFIVYPGVLMQYTTCNSNIPCFENQREVAEFYIEQYEKHGIDDLQFFPFLKGIGSCMAENPNNLIIGPSGEIHLCLKDVGDEKEIIGNILSEGRKLQQIAEYCSGYFAFSNDECKKCNVVALCGGGCPNLKYRNAKYGEKHDCCVPFKNKTILKKYLDIHYEIVKPD